MAERRKLFHVEALTFILGYDPKKKEVTIQQIAKWLEVTPEFIIDCDVNQLHELCLKAQQIRGLNIEKEIKEKINDYENCAHDDDEICCMCV